MEENKTIGKEEMYTPEEILQAMSAVLMKEGQIYIDLVLIELKRNFYGRKKNNRRKLGRRI